MKKGRVTTIILVLVFLTGLGLLLYPSIANFWNTKHQTQAIKNYVQAVEKMDKADFESIWQEVEAYNRSLLDRQNGHLISDEQKSKYYQLLDVDSTGIMGYIEIPSIEVSLPIYHGSDDDVLQVATGHYEWSSLPSGGESTHCVISGHRGLPSSKLFTDLDELAVGDIFYINVLDKTLCYEIDRVLIVKPEETSPLMIEKGKTLCTLVTCTPYGINSHRILVRGHLVSDALQISAGRIVSDAVKVEPLTVAVVIAVPLVVVLVVILFVPLKLKKRKGGKKNEKTE